MAGAISGVLLSRERRSAPRWAGPTWREFLAAQAYVIIAGGVVTLSAGNAAPVVADLPAAWP